MSYVIEPQYRWLTAQIRPRTWDRIKSKASWEHCTLSAVIHDWPMLLPKRLQARVITYLTKQRPEVTIELRDRAALIQQELDRLAVALRDHERPECYREFYAAQQALSWALKPDGFAAPFDAIRGIQGAPAGCSDVPHPPSS